MKSQNIMVIYIFHIICFSLFLYIWNVPWFCRISSVVGGFMKNQELKTTKEKTSWQGSMATPWKINMWTWKWCFGKSFSFSIGWFLGPRLIIMGVANPVRLGLSWPLTIRHLLGVAPKTTDHFSTVYEFWHLTYLPQLSSLWHELVTV